MRRSPTAKISNGYLSQRGLLRWKQEEDAKAGRWKSSGDYISSEGLSQAARG